MIQHRVSGPWWIIGWGALATSILAIGPLGSAVTGGEGRCAEVERVLAQTPKVARDSLKRMNVVKRMTEDLRRLIDCGTSRDNQKAANDTTVRFETTQEKRWAPARQEPK